MSAPLIIRGIAVVLGAIVGYFIYKNITSGPQANQPEQQNPERRKSRSPVLNGRNRCMKCLGHTPNPRNREFLKCGHVLHKDCFQALVLGGETRCPECCSRISQSEIDEILGITDNKNSCAICLEQINHRDIKILNCNHSFHEDCISDMIMNEGRKCPSCRKNIPNREVEEIRLLRNRSRSTMTM